MPSNPLKHHQIPPDVVLCAVRWYCRFALSCRDEWKLLAERGIDVDASTIHRLVRRFNPKITKQSFKDRSGRPLNQHGQLADLRLAARRSIKAAKAFLKQACEKARLCLPHSITADKARSYARVVSEMNRFVIADEGILHIHRKWHNNRIEAIRTIKRGHGQGKSQGFADEIRLVEPPFGPAA